MPGQARPGHVRSKSLRPACAADSAAAMRDLGARMTDALSDSGFRGILALYFLSRPRRLLVDWHVMLTCRTLAYDIHADDLCE